MASCEIPYKNGVFIRETSKKIGYGFQLRGLGTKGKTVAGLIATDLAFWPLVSSSSTPIEIDAGLHPFHQATPRPIRNSDLVLDLFILRSHFLMSVVDIRSIIAHQSWYTLWYAIVTSNIILWLFIAKTCQITDDLRWFSVLWRGGFPVGKRATRWFAGDDADGANRRQSQLFVSLVSTVVGV